jgi:hypothetical protein
VGRRSWRHGGCRWQKPLQKLGAFCCSTRTGLQRLLLHCHCRHRPSLETRPHLPLCASHAIALRLPLFLAASAHSAVACSSEPSSRPDHLPTRIRIPYSVTSRCCATSDRESSRAENHVCAHLTSIVVARSRTLRHWTSSQYLGCLLLLAVAASGSARQRIAMLPATNLWTGLSVAAS